MEIRFDNYRISTDRYNYILSEFKGVYLDKKGAEQERWDTMGFWGSLEAIVRVLPDLVIRRSGGNLHEAMVEVRAVKESLENVMREVKK